MTLWIICVKSLIMSNKLSMVSIWRKNLCNLNKTRDNHYREFGKHFDFTVLVRDDALIGDHVEECGTKIVRIKSRRGLIGILVFYIRAFSWVIKCNNKRKFDILHAPINEEVTGWLLYHLMMKRTCFVLDLWDVPVSHLKPDVFTPKELPWSLYEYVTKYSVKNADVVICGILQEGLSSYAIPNDKVIATENGVRLELFNPDANAVAQRKLDGDSFEVSLLYVGYLHPKRGLIEIIGAVSELLDRGHKCRLKVIGPSDDEALMAIADSILKYGLENSVEVISEVDSHHIPAYIATADVCLCPLQDIEQYKWSYPVKIYEYLAMGKPVVASNLPGIRSLINDSINGFIYADGCQKELVEALERFFDMKTSGFDFKTACRRSVMNKNWRDICESISMRLISHCQNKI
jgi:glycosyltransferase involved in cell wall biosynthesis